MTVLSRSGLMAIGVAAGFVALMAAGSAGLLVGGGAAAAVETGASGGGGSGEGGASASASVPWGGSDLSDAFAAVSPGWEGIATRPDKLRRTAGLVGSPPAPSSVPGFSTPSAEPPSDPLAIAPAPAPEPVIGDAAVDPGSQGGGYVGSTPLPAGIGYAVPPSPSAPAAPPTSTPTPAPTPVSAVPEPSTWLSMVLGMGLLGAFMRRRRAGGSPVSA